ncbi:hypothetical protein [Henriciella sp.]|uniref:hypothetical protein n=1 Tax=Henriciella sp. TaxID=1968823 RepID=UPI002611E181|nr:hypothetical protein [Henriciella sp.]
MQKLALEYLNPPIPDRRFDWGAFIEGDEERGYLGFGGTPTEAVAEALANDPDFFHEEDWTVSVTQPRRSISKGAA